MTLNLKNWHPLFSDGESFSLRLRHPETDAKRSVALYMPESGECVLKTGDRGDPWALEMAIRDLAGVAELERLQSDFIALHDVLFGFARDGGSGQDLYDALTVALGGELPGEMSPETRAILGWRGEMEAKAKRYDRIEADIIGAEKSGRLQTRKDVTDAIERVLEVLRGECDDQA